MPHSLIITSPTQYSHNTDSVRKYKNKKKGKKKREKKRQTVSYPSRIIGYPIWCFIYFIKKKLSYPCNRPWRSIGLWDAKATSYFLDNRFTDGGEVVSLTRRPPFTTPRPPGRFLVLISGRGWVDPRAIVQLEVLGQLKHSISHRESNPRRFGL
jgi:hypothetical protein